MTPHRNSDRTASPETSDASGFYALSIQQRQLIALLGGSSATWRARLSLDEPIDAHRLAAAMTEVRSRHEILRSSFVSLPDYGEPVQRIHEADEPVGLKARMAVDEPTAIDLEAPVLAVDAQSWRVIARDLRAFYLGEPRHGFEEPVQYADYVAWQEDVREVHPAVRHLQPSTNEKERPRPALRGRTAPHPRLSTKLAESVFPIGTTDAIQALALETGVPEAAILLASWTLFVEALSSSAPVFHAVDGRGIAEADDAVGPYSEWRQFLPPARETTFGDYLRSCGQLLRAENEGRQRRASAITPAEFAEGYAFEWIRLNTQTQIVELGDCPAAASLRLRAVAGSGITVAFFGDVREWSAEAGRLLLDRLCCGVAQLASQLHRPLSLVRWIGDRDRAIIRRIATSTIHSIPAADLPHMRFALMARDDPGAPALIDANGVVLTYGAVSDRVRELSDKLRARDLRDGDIVALELDRAGLVVAILAVWSCGTAFVALPPGMTETRRAAIAAVARPRFRIRPGFEIDGPSDDSDSEARLRGIACLAFTSGSTGTPRGVLQPYTGVASYLAFVRDLTRIGPGDVVQQMASPDFDASIRDSIGPLTAGGAIVLAPRGGLFDAERAVRTLVEHKVTALFSVVPSMLRALIYAGEREGRSNYAVRTILCAGEPLFCEDVDRARRVFGERLTICNLYGPTECTMTSTIHRTDGGAVGDLHGIVPIGVPIPHARCVILDADLAPVPVGEAGEIYIGGLGLAPGYVGEPAATASRFMPEPDGRGTRLYRTGDLGRLREDGVLQFVGRVDDQVKIRGTRVEPAEVAAVLAAHADVAEAAVLADRAGDRVLLRGFVSLKADLATAGRPLTPRGAPLAEMNDYETDFFYQRVFVDRADFSSGVSLGPGDVVLDVGANIGLFTLFVARFCPGVRVHAFEPIPDIFARLAENARDLDSVHPHCAALGSAPGRQPFEYYPASSCQSGRYPDRDQEGTILRAILQDRVQAELGRAPSARTLHDLGRLLEDRLTGQEVVCNVTTISEFIAREHLQRLDLLKIDVEKSELDVLFGIAPEDWPKIRQVVVEVHAIESALDTVIAMLEGLGFEVSSRQEPVFEKTCVFAVHALRPGQERGPFPLPAAAEPRKSAVKVTPAELLDHLSARLPAEAVPGKLVILPELPRNARGKVDRDRLLALADRRPCGTPPSDLIEEAIADMWDEILGSGPYSREDDFFQGGGHSLSAMRLAARLSNVFGVALPLRELFEQSTIAAIADHLRERGHFDGGAKETWPFTVVHPPLLALGVEGALDAGRLADAVARVIDAQALAADVVTLRAGDEAGAIDAARARLRTGYQARGQCVIQPIDRGKHIIALSFSARRLDLRSLSRVAGHIFDTYGGDIYVGGTHEPASSVSTDASSPALPDAVVRTSTWILERNVAANLDLFVQDYGLHRSLAVLGTYAAFLSSFRQSERIMVALPRGHVGPCAGHGGFRCVSADARHDPSFIEYVEQLRDAMAASDMGTSDSVPGAFTASFVSHALPASAGQPVGLKVDVVDQCEAFSDCCLAMLRSPFGIRLTLSHSHLLSANGVAVADRFAAFAGEALASPNDALSAIAERSGLYVARR